MKDEATFIGTVRRVVGATVHVVLSPELPSTSPIVHGRVYRIGQIGSFVRIPLGFLNVYGIVSTVGAVAVRSDDDQAVAGDAAERTLEVKLIGEAYQNSAFQRGLSSHPTIDDEVHVVTEADLRKIYEPAGTAPVPIGVHSASESLPATLDLDKLVTRHAAILGSTGSGKSNTVAAVLKAVTDGSLPQARVIVIDPHGEYGAAFKGLSRVYSIGDKTNPFVLPYWCLPFDELAWFLVERKSATEALQDGYLRDKIFEMRKAAAAKVTVGSKQTALTADDITADSPLPFDIRELWYHFDRAERVTYKADRTTEFLVAEGNAQKLVSAQFKPASPGNAEPFKPTVQYFMGAYTHKILQKLKDRRYDFLLNPGDYDGVKKDLHDLLSGWLDHDQPITVFDLGGVPPDVMDLVVGQMTRVLFESMYWGRDIDGIGKRRPVLMVFEEAHRYLPSKDGNFIQGYARRSVQRVLKEGRKYGTGAVIVSQRPSELDETILSQCGTFIALRLSNAQDQGRVMSAMPDELSGLVDLLPALRTGEAVISGEATQIPSRVRVKLIEPRPSSGDPEVSKMWGQKAKATTEYVAAITNWRRQRSN